MTKQEIPLTQPTCIGCGYALWTNDINICSTCAPESKYTIDQIRSMQEIVKAGYPFNYAIACVHFIINHGTCHHNKAVMSHCVFTWCLNYRGRCEKHKSGQPLDLSECE